MWQIPKLTVKDQDIHLACFCCCYIYSNQYTKQSKTQRAPYRCHIADTCRASCPGGARSRGSRYAVSVYPAVHTGYTRTAFSSPCPVRAVPYVCLALQRSASFLQVTNSHVQATTSWKIRNMHTKQLIERGKNRHDVLRSAFFKILWLPGGVFACNDTNKSSRKYTVNYKNSDTTLFLSVATSSQH